MSKIGKPPKPAMGNDDPMSDVQLYASRVRVYPRAVHGIARNIKWAILILCLTVYYVTPWIRWNRGAGRPDQAVLLDIAHERFYIFGITFWPEDIYYLTGALILASVGLFLVTSLAGRIWCGYACPQTVWTDLFMWVERLIEGDRNARMKRDHGATSFDKTWRKLAKHAMWMGIAFWTGGAWIMYYVDAPTVTVQFWTGQASTEVYFFTGLFTVFTYVLAGWAREQVCTYMCPWPRFQASMLDEQSFIVTYQKWRGDPRGKGRRDAEGMVGGTKLGDCIDCNACVNVCPTGIDIRDGVQLGCINCGLCVDACNEIMTKAGRPKWLILWDTLARQEAKTAHVSTGGRHEAIHLLRPRTLIYVTALVLATTVMGTALAMRNQVSLSVLHDRASLFVKVRDGSVRNAYAVKISNKTADPTTFALAIAGLPGAGTQGVGMAIADDTDHRQETLSLDVPRDSIGTFRVLVFGQPAKLAEGSQKVVFSVRNTTTGETIDVSSVFMGPT
ncbi:MAG: cytochrome c oxidase accessory protein CcoG, partial [Variovorax sp.]